MNHIDGNKLGLVIGGLFGLVHVVWVGLVMGGWAKPLADYILRLHFVSPSYTLTAFNVTDAVLLIGIASAVGYGVGQVAACLWGGVHRGD